MYILDIEDIKRAKITLSLIVVNVACFICFNYILDLRLFYLLVLNNSKVIDNQELWRLFTSMFLHADELHLFSNMIALLIFGSVVENTISKGEYIIIYFISGLIGNIFSLILLPKYIISLGASGAIFGLIGAAFILITREEPTLLFFGLAYLGYFVVSSFTPGINYTAHLFGLAGGLLIGYIISRKMNKNDYY
ncbi:MAG: rhomboid family intramembrane serine protease [Promethearchaeota archaeon]